MSHDIVLDKADVSVGPIEREICECEERVVTHTVWVDYRSAGMRVAAGYYCHDCANEIAVRIQDGLPRPKGE